MKRATIQYREFNGEIISVYFNRGVTIYEFGDVRIVECTDTPIVLVIDRMGRGTPALRTSFVYVDAMYQVRESLIISEDVVHG